MTFANGSQHSLHYVAEVTAGTTPSTPAFKEFRHNGTTLALTKETIQSEELGGRQIKCFKHGNSQIGGDVTAELTYADFQDQLQAALMGTIEVDEPAAGTDQLKVGSTRRTFTFERRFADINKYIRYKGCEFNSLALTVAPNAIVSTTFGVVGLSQDSANTAVAGATYTAASGACPFDSFTGSISEGGSVIAIITQIEMTLDNGIENQFAIGNKSPVGKSLGKSNLSGTLTAYFDDVTLLNKFINETSSSISFTLVDAAGNEILFSMPNVKYNGGQPDTNGDGPITIALPFQALYDATAESQLVVEFTAA
jgi:hypothetical protein